MSDPHPTHLPDLKLSVVLPCFNEDGNVERVADELELMFEGIQPEPEFIFVDNGSRDGTRRILERIVRSHPHCRMVALDANRGYGGGILAGMQVATGDILAIGTGDAQVRAEDAIKAFTLIRRGDVDYVKAYRVGRQDGPQRRLVSLCYNWIFHGLFGAPYADINGPLKMMRRTLWDRLGLVSRDWFIDAEIALRIKGIPDVRLVDFPVSWFKREAGSSHVNWRSIAEFLTNLWVVKTGGLAALEARWR